MPGEGSTGLWGAGGALGIPWDRPRSELCAAEGRPRTGPALGGGAGRVSSHHPQKHRGAGLCPFFLHGREQLSGLPAHPNPLFSTPQQPQSGGDSEGWEVSLQPPPQAWVPLLAFLPRAVPHKGRAPHQPPRPGPAVSGMVPREQGVGTGAQLQGAVCRTPAGPARPGRDGDGQQVSTLASDHCPPASFPRE